MKKTLLLLAFCLTFLLCGCGTSLPQGALPLLAEVSTQRLQSTTTYLCNTIGPRVQGTEKEKETALYLQSQLESLGFSETDQTLEVQSFILDNGTVSKNIIAYCNKQPQTASPEPFWMVVAHYDTVADCPGARDNGASVAALLEMAALTKTTCSDLPTEVRFIFLGSEEGGYHGSRAYAQTMTQAQREACLGVFNMDISAASKGIGAVLTCNTLGFRDTSGTYTPGDIFIPAQNRVSKAIAEASALLYPQMETLNPVHYGDSDHLSFHDVGIDAANVCWRTPVADFTKLPEEYHLPTDVAETLDYDTLKITVSCILQSLSQ